MTVIAHNITAMNTQRQYGINTDLKAKTAEKLASGYRINRAADDAAGLAISEKMRSQIRGLTKGVQNTEEGVSLCHVADGALNEVSAMLHRMKELAVQSANGTNTNSDRENLQDEVSQLLEEIDRISEDTEFNTIHLFELDTQIIDDIETVTPSIEFPVSKLNVTGTPTDIVATNYAIKADETGFSINTDSYSWDMFECGTATLADNPLEEGIYSFDYRGLTLSLTVDSDATIDDVIKRMNGASFATKVTSSATVNKINATGTYGGWYQFANPISSSVEIKLHADDTGVWTTFDGVTYSVIFNGEKSYWHNMKELQMGGDDMVNTAGHLVDLSALSTQVGLNHFTDQFNVWANIESINNATKQDLITALDNATVHVELDTYNSNPSKNKYFYKVTGIDLNPTPSTMPPTPYLDYVKQTDIVIDGYEESVVETISGLWIQSGANEGQGMWLTIDNMSTTILGLADMDISTTDGATKALGQVREALAKVSKNRSKIGAQQNRLEHTIDRENVAIENLTASESGIRDADMASEMVNLSKYNILEQTGQAMMAQANQSKQGVLQLLSQS